MDTVMFFMQFLHYYISTGFNDEDDDDHDHKKDHNHNHEHKNL